MLYLWSVKLLIYTTVAPIHGFSKQIFDSKFDFEISIKSFWKFGQISKRKIFHFFHFCHLIRTFCYLAKMPCCCSAYVNKQRQSISNFDRDQNRGKLLWWKLAFEACLGLLRYQISPERILCTGQIVNKEDTSFCRSTKIFHSLNWRLRDLMYLPMLA